MGGNMLDKPGYFNPASHRFKIISSKKILSAVIVFYCVLSCGFLPPYRLFRRQPLVEMVGDEVTSL
jgi:hypothetical protein